MLENQPTYQRLHTELSSLISSAQPGQRLPSEPFLAKQLGVSRATLREAMRAFEAQGLIRRKQGLGTFVVGGIPVIETGLEVLESIETVAQRIHLDVSMGALQVKPFLADREQADRFGILEKEPLVKISRVIRAENRSVAYLVDVVPQGILNPSDLNENFSGSVLDFLLNRGNPPLLNSRTEINAVAASHEVAKALEIQRGDVLLCFVAYLYSTSGQVVDHSYSYFLPGYFHFHVVRSVGGLRPASYTSIENERRS